MKLIRAQVQNFRSVDDSNEFTLDEHITCLVGKNESGKTALLTALYGLNPIFDDAMFDRQKDYPRRYLADYEERHDGEDPYVITTWWKINSDEKKSITDKFGDEVLKSDVIEVLKGYSNQTSWRIDFDEAAVVKHLIDTSSLHDEEKAQISTVKTVSELRTKIAAFSDTSTRHLELIQKIDQSFPDASVARGIIKLLKYLSLCCFHSIRKCKDRSV